MVKKRQAGKGPAAAKKAKTAQPGIAASFARAAAAAPADATGELVVLEQARQRDLLDPRLIEELSSQGDKYLQAWSEKCYGLREGGRESAIVPPGSSLKARRAAAAGGFSKEDADLDAAALRYMDAFRHLHQQACLHGAALDPSHLELLVLVLRSDVLHTVPEVSHQAAALLHLCLRRFPYASLGRLDGRPYLAIDELSAWEPLAAVSNLQGLSKKYIFEEAIKDGGHNYRLDHTPSTLLPGSHKKGGRLPTCFQLVRLCFERAVDSAEVDHNGDVMLLRYLLTLLHQDTVARLEVFAAHADMSSGAAQRRRQALLQNSLLWRIWLDEQETDKSRLELMRLIMRLIVGVGSEEDLQEVDEEAAELDKDAEPAAPCICTPRELAAIAAAFLGLLLDLFSAAEAAGGFQKSAANRMHRINARLRLDQAMKELFWKNGTEAVCLTDAASRTFLAALAPGHRLRLLCMLCMQHVGKAYYAEEAAKRPCVARAKEIDHLTMAAESGPFRGAFLPDPVVALQCLNQDQRRSLKVFALVNRDSAINNLMVLAAGIAQAAHSLAAGGGGGGGGLPPCVGVAGELGDSGRDGEEASEEGKQLLQQEIHTLLKFLADRHRESAASGKHDRALSMSRASLFDLLHAQAAISALR